jgi:hypothetical protein
MQTERLWRTNHSEEETKAAAGGALKGVVQQGNRHVFRAGLAGLSRIFWSRMFKAKSTAISASRGCEI